MAESNTDIEAGALEESESEELSGELRIMTWEGFDIVEPSLVNMENVWDRESSPMRWRERRC